jgi:hypothetical protein
MELSMGNAIVSLLPLIIGSALVPAQIILYILLLKSSRQGLLKASAYVGGMTTVRLLQGLFFGLILTNSTAATRRGKRWKKPNCFGVAVGDWYLISDDCIQTMEQRRGPRCSTA